MPFPFQYPARPHERQHGPRGYRTPESYRPWLRDEFAFRCVYCLRREQWDRSLSMEVEHFQPTSQSPEQHLTYDNLLYACPHCNRAKGSQAVPSPERSFIEDHVEVQSDGTIVGHSSEARSIIEKLRLNSAAMVHFRRMWLEIIALAARFEPELFQQLMGFPDDPPDLSSLRPPEGNSRPAGVTRSHFARRERGELMVEY